MRYERTNKFVLLEYYPAEPQRVLVDVGDQQREISKGRSTGQNSMGAFQSPDDSGRLTYLQDHVVQRDLWHQQA